MATIIKKSPKGLVGVRTRTSPGLTITWCKDKGFELPPTGRHEIKLSPRLVARNLERLKKHAIEIIESEREWPADLSLIIRQSEQADRAYWAARVLRDLDYLERHRRKALGLVQTALVLAWEFYLLAYADREREIVRGSENIDTLRRNLPIIQEVNAERRAERQPTWAWCNAQARSIWERHPKLSKKAVALQLKKKHSKKLTESVETIRKKLKKPGTAQ